MSRQIIRLTDSFKNALTSHNIPGLRWLIDGFNFYDKQRVLEVGADRVAAEWVVRCGGVVKFDRFKTRFDDYNTLIRATAELDPAKPSDACHLVEIDASNSCVSGFGCRHFTGLNHLSRVLFINCKNLQDFGLEEMGKQVGSRLPHLELEKCPRISEYGLKHLETFSGLKTLKLKNLPNVYKPQRSIDSLKKALPNCEVHYE
ncbi:ATP synthase subunit s, mitochondrial [Aphelenchoides besseyi]|nr:ATP synthase subunit s, mitochondrial [Aphelenchoides besseyi]